MGRYQTAGNDYMLILIMEMFHDLQHGPDTHIEHAGDADDGGLESLQLLFEQVEPSLVVELMMFMERAQYFQIQVDYAYRNPQGFDSFIKILQAGGGIVVIASFYGDFTVDYLQVYLWNLH